MRINTKNGVMRKAVLQAEVDKLQEQIEREESNYKNAIQLGKDYETLRHIREIIRELKERLRRIRKR